MDFYSENFLKEHFRKKNQLLIKADLGKGKPTIHNIPEEICFGVKIKRDSENATQRSMYLKLVQDWNYHVHS
jgi:hypothetical protein